MRIGKQMMVAFLVMAAQLVVAQPKLEIDLKKPKEFEERKLGSEKLAEKKFTVPRHFFQNMFTHYNYYFNANNLLNDIIENAKKQGSEDFTQLLPFYNYTLDATSKVGELDSILQKCTAGILLHDLRNDWIDNMYLLIGKTYLLRKNFDSAASTFQYINYAYSPKEKDGYDKVIGSNSNEGGNAFSIATKEKKSIIKKVFEKPPSRNESFVWQIRTFTEIEQYIDAASLITTLRNDPNFPARLKEELAEVEAYNYYKQGLYDSSAKYLSKAVSLAVNSTEKARWYYLVGQMYQETKQFNLAAEYFNKCVKTTLDPVMEVYARLGMLRLRKNDDPKLIQQNINEIVKMARKEKYELYRDIIYYAAGLVELERNQYAAAEDFLLKSIKYNDGNTTQKTKTFLVLGNLSFDAKQYGKAGNYYDSLSIGLLDSNIAKTVSSRKPGCKTVYDKDRIIYLEDSLQAIAALPEAQRNAYIRALAKRLRKEKGLKDYIDSSSNGLQTNSSQIGNTTSSLFTDAKADFYFYDAVQRSAGFGIFKQKWGARPNVDNWQRTAAVQTASFNNGDDLKAKIADANNELEADSKNGVLKKKNKTDVVDINLLYNPTDISFDALYTNLPIEKEKLDISNKNINDALLQKARALQNQIEDLPEATKTYEVLLARIGEDTLAEEIVFNLIYCYGKTGNALKAESLRKQLEKEYKNGSFNNRLNEAKKGTDKKNMAVTEQYKLIYNLFIEGQFDQAISEKKKADSAFGKNYWTPQLLYIEAVYYIRQRQDSIAIITLSNLIATSPNTALALKASNLINVVKRRKEIEDHLNNLTVTREKVDTIIIPTIAATNDAKPTVPSTNPSASNNVTKPLVPKKDSTIQAATLPNNPFTINPAQPHMVMIVLEKVDPVYINETMVSFNRYNQQKLSSQKLVAEKIKLNSLYALITINSADFANAAAALLYVDKVKPKSASEIVPWLETNKYSIVIISQNNLDLIKQNQDVAGYLKVLKTAMQGKF